MQIEYERHARRHSASACRPKQYVLCHVDVLPGIDTIRVIPRQRQAAGRFVSHGTTEASRKSCSKTARQGTSKKHTSTAQGRVLHPLTYMNVCNPLLADCIYICYRIYTRYESKTSPTSSKLQLSCALVPCHSRNLNAQHTQTLSRHQALHPRHRELRCRKADDV